MEAVCGKVWRNGEGQLSFLKHAVSAPPEIFTFSHSSRKQVRRIPALVVYVAFAAQRQMQWLQLKAHCRVYNNTNCLGYHLVCFSVNFFCLRIFVLHIWIVLCLLTIVAVAVLFFFPVRCLVSL